jgi:DNA-binding transcriptional MerR regulator
MTTTELAKYVGVSSKTIKRREARGDIPKPFRDYRGWRKYEEGEIKVVKQFFNGRFKTKPNAKVIRKDKK